MTTRTLRVASLRTWLGFGIALFISLPSWAQEFPTVGLLYNTKEAHSLSYRCSMLAPSKMECEFVQTAIRRKGDPNTLARLIEQSKREFRSGKQFASAKDCQAYGEMVDVLEGRKKAPLPEGLAKLTAMEKRDLLEIANVMTSICSNPTEEGYIRLGRLSHARDMRTCLVSSQTFRQTFGYIGGRDSASSAWVVESRPEGVCGVVQLSRFTPERSDVGDYTFWRYTAKKAITNPQAIAFLGVGNNIKCSELDEAEYFYDWRSKQQPLQCDYIEFSVL
ncbi:MAG: hypothetical protein D3M94_07965 [Rhodocyclales bacterium GT-UBC]|nr:MAG: hypothetical protein D3M94_07965 [Rhodocyclales bacterium GT-UBC]